MLQMRILLLRHGETVWNRERRMQGRRDIALNETGRQQAQRAGAFLAQSFPDTAQILCSPLKRAEETARIIAAETGYPQERVLIQESLIERDFGEAEGLVYEEVRVRYPDDCFPGMETLEELYERAEGLLAALERDYPEKTVLAVAHGALIKAVLHCASRGRILYHDADIWMENGSICCLDREEGHFGITLYHAEEDYRQESWCPKA